MFFLHIEKRLSFYEFRVFTIRASMLSLISASDNFLDKAQYLCILELNSELVEKPMHEPW